MTFKQRLLNWGGLFISTMVLAIVLSQQLTPPQQLQPNPTVAQTPIETRSATPATAPLFEPQVRYDRSLAHYATVSRGDGSFRQIFIDAGSIDAIQPGKPLPDGTLFVMETWYSSEAPGTVFVKQKQNGEWQYGSFSPNQPHYQMRFSGSCHSCHAPFRETDFTLTKPLLEAALRSRQVQTAYCSRPGRTPCAPEAYIPSENQAQ
ncbi:cytochrome P460 family protein [Leptolyngbya sp. FACHB-261]|uniref:cytochrome P460 family protein n=1 Tax=Leptolyngbya sp. FACHB-261 TaxID=2692806 RepID=UPI0016855A57|nr:cytochrome P460 family protein [Leptolyngbya sp. FACHB-261]MBD2102345.1 cytochrome P460 family protein [Leptolyngbya sp. FACHB-261]